MEAQSRLNHIEYLVYRRLFEIEDGRRLTNSQMMARVEHSKAAAKLGRALDKAEREKNERNGTPKISR